jgi:methionyl-tRNA synthetase
MTRLERAQIDRLLDANRATLQENGAAGNTSNALGERKKRAALPQTALLPGDPPKTTTPAATPITIEQFSAIDLRVARIVAAEAIPEAHKLVKLTVDVGERHPDGSPRHRTIFAGIKAAYPPEALVGRLTVIVANLAPRQMRFGLSEGMVLAASDEHGTTPGLFLIAPDSGAEVGMRVK